MTGYGYEHQHEMPVAASIGEVFAFLADPRSVPALVPPWLGMRFVAGPERDLGLGSEREYVLRWSGIAVYLRMRVTEFARPYRLAFEQVMGPWQRYVRTFTLREVAGGTSVVEHAAFRTMPGVIDHLVHRFGVAPRLPEAAAFAHAALCRHLERSAPAVEASHA